MYVGAIWCIMLPYCSLKSKSAAWLLFLGHMLACFSCRLTFLKKDVLMQCLKCTFAHMFKCTVSEQCFCNINVRRIICFDFNSISVDPFSHLEVHPVGLELARGMFSYLLFYQSWIKSSIYLDKLFQNGFD